MWMSNARSFVCKGAASLQAFKSLSFLFDSPFFKISESQKPAE